MAQAQADLEQVKNTQKQDIDRVREEIRSAQAKVQLAEARLIRYKKLERESATSTSIAELSSGLEIEAKIPEASIAKIFREQTVNIQVDAYPDQTFKGKVSLIAPRAV
ncbi:MAG: efflux RND transporter periplasmic adaptor subunit [Hydrococcus sp. Prado102]|jgi:multidrug resistance efflux pump|nr:efflux RND transporter periplasmic adaptor subunit [Hydrococcus sp. Prado102]